VCDRAHGELVQNSSMRLILASASPRRAELLRAAGYAFDIVASEVDEATRGGESPSLYVRRLAADKSAAVAARAAADAIVLGADTTVVVDGEILAKPLDDADAGAMLEKLSGRRHEVITGISLRRGAFELGRVETTAVFFAPLTDEEIAWYVATGEGRDKAGAYAIQGVASRFIPRIEGSYSNVVGLPVAAVRELLTEISGTRPDRSSPRR
jgi:septum formation protein